MSSDRITITGLRARGRHGWYDWEREQVQEFVVDVELTVDTRAAGLSDDLADTVDYGALATTVAAIVEGEPVRLVEALAQRIADACLTDPRVESATVTVHKPQAPVQVQLVDVAVTVTRGRS
jgi:7,8-dihydroneopterin aldolase/epimerase/oxygenase